MKSMKKLLSLCLAVTICLASFAFTLTASAWEAHTNAVDLRVGLINDSHITATGGAVPALEKALTTIKTLGGSQLDGLALVGDVIYYPSASSDPTDTTPYELVYGALEETGFTRSDVLAYAMGNHEFPQSNVDETVSKQAINTFETYTEFDMNHHAVTNGFHFIAGGAKDYNGQATAETQAYLMAEIDKALAETSSNTNADGGFDAGVIPDSTEPVFLLLHHPIEGTVFSSTTDKYTDEFVAFLNNRPQVVNITAHWHSPAQLPDNIWQGGFTSYQAPLIGGGYLEEVGATSTGTISGISQGSMIEVKDNVVSLYKMDYNTGEYIGTPWIIDIPAIVEDRLDADAENDMDSMLYSPDKRTATDAPAFPADSALSLTVVDDTVHVTYPNTAVMKASGDGTLQDGFTRGYKVVIENAAGTVIKSAVYMADFYRAEADRAATCTRSVNGLNPGMSYVAKVYPMSPLLALGEPLSASFETEPLELNENAVRYEFEDYCTTHSGSIKESEYASGGKLVYSAYNTDWIPAGSLIYTDGTHETHVPLVYTFTVTVPYTCEYDVNFAVNDLKSSYVSLVTVLLDGTEIGNGNGTPTANLSLDGTYPYSNTPLALFTSSGIALEAGKEYTVTLSIDEPAVNKESGTQPYLFCADYIEFVPKMQILNPGKTTRMEFEDYASEFTYTGSVKESVNASKGKYIHFDTAGKADHGPSILEVPIYVTAAGNYKVEYIASSVGSTVDVYLDDTQIDTATTTISTESKPDGAENYPYFNEYYHAGNKYAFTAEFPEGEHTLAVYLNDRGADGARDVAICIDYIDFTYDDLVVGKNQSQKFGFHDHADKFDRTLASWPCEDTYTGQLAYHGGGATTTFTLPFAVADTGSYEFEFAGAYTTDLSDIYFYLDSTENEPFYIINSSNTDYIDISQGDKQLYDGDTTWLAKQYNFLEKLSAGSHKLIMVAEARSWNNSVAFAWDYMEISYKREKISKTETTRIELENYKDLISIPQTDDTNGVAAANSGAGASGGAYLAIDTTDGLAAEETYSFSFPVTIERAGMYTFSYVGNSGTSLTKMFIDSTSGTELTASLAETVIDDTKVDGTIQYFSSSWAIAKHYAGRALLPAGNHELVIQLTRRGENDFARYLDYVEFVPLPAVVVAAEGKVTAELETYSSGSVVSDLSYASGNAVSHANYSTYCPTVIVPVNVEKSGYYDVEYVIGNIGKDTTENSNHDYLSQVDIYIDGKKIGDNASGYTENLGDIYTVWTTLDVCSHNTTVYLEAGEHELTMDVGITADSRYKYLLDYISFAPANSLTVEGDTATAVVTYDSAVTGKAILALYRDSEMVSMNAIDVADKETVVVTAPTDGSFTTAKVFLWKDLTNIEPLEEAIPLTLAE